MEKSHCYPRRVDTVISRQPFATSPLDGNSPLDHRHVLELQVVSTIHLKCGSRRHPSRSTNGKTVRAHCQYTSDRQYNYNNKLYNLHFYKSVEASALHSPLSLTASTTPKNLGTCANSALFRYYLPRLQLSSSTLALARKRTPCWFKQIDVVYVVFDDNR